jgi:hypothetical protein
MNDLARYLIKITEGLVRALSQLGPPFLVIGILFLCLPATLLNAMGLDPNDPVLRALAGGATLAGAALSVFQPPPWVQGVAAAIWNWAWVRFEYWRMPLRAKLLLGPAASGYHRYLYAHPNDEDAQLLVDRGLAYLDVRADAWMRLEFVFAGRLFIQANRKRLRKHWLSALNKVEVESIEQVVAEAERREQSHLKGGLN